MAAALFDESQLYGHNKLDKPDTMKIFGGRAEEALKTAPASKDSADLNKKIQAALKKAKAQTDRVYSRPVANRMQIRWPLWANTWWLIWPATYAR